MSAARHRPSIAVVLAALIALAAPAVAHAGFFGGDVIDGPSADIVSVGDLDVSHDGGGAVVYVKRDGGIEHVFVSRLAAGAWTPPERLDPGFVTPSSSPVVAVSDGGRFAVAFVNAGQLFTVLRPAGATTWPAPVPLPGPGATPDIDMSINGTAYVVWTAGGDVRAARADRTETGFTPLDTPLDVDPSRTAGSSTGRPRVAVSADGTAAATWGEAGHVFVRRLFGMRVSDSPQDATVTDFAGHAGSTADTPDIDMWDDSSFAWVTFRQMFADGTRVLARRLAGSELEPAVDVSGGGFGGENADAPRLDVNGRGETIFANETTGSNTPFSTLVHLDAVGSPVAPAGAQAIPPQPQAAIGETGDAVVAWLQSAGAGDPPSVHGRFFKEALPAGDGELSNPALGGVDPAAGFDAAADRTGNVAVVYVQGSGDQRRLVGGAWDRPPSSFTANTTSHWRRPVPLRWSPSIELWGPVTYTVVFDGKPLVTTTNTSSPASTILPDGRHRWRVIATDRRGQSTSSRLRELLIDGNPPLVRLKISGRRAAGSRLRLASRAFDRDSGLRLVRFDFGDNTPTVLGTTVTHFFRRGRFTVKVTAIDRAGNRSVTTSKIRIK
jgi:hypothetical protein